MKNKKIPRALIKRWADSLYAISKGIKNSSTFQVTTDVGDLSRSMYKLLEIDSSPNVNVSTDFINETKDKLLLIANNKDFDKIIKSSLIRISEGLEEFLPQKSLILQKKISENQNFLQQTLHWSIILGFTLWYGGQSFSLTKKELNRELGFASNDLMNPVYEKLRSQEIIIEKKTGLIVLNPRCRNEVDMATLLLVSLGTTIMFKSNNKRGYSTVQSGFLRFSGNNHHPMVSLSENIRSYVSDYCQRIFGLLFDRLKEKKIDSDYAVVRRFLTRLSLYPSSEFVISQDLEIIQLIEKMKSAGIIKEVSNVFGEKFILLEKAVMKY